jgi:allantoate deiminase
VNWRFSAPVQKTVSTTELAEQVLARCNTLAAFSEDSGSIRRPFLSPPMHKVHREIASWLEPLGVNLRIDAVGNFRALYPRDRESDPRLLMGSHLDTVPNAGRYDGILGVVIAAALLEALHGEKLPYAMELIGFSDEEGTRFGVPFIGSRALVGRVDDNLLNSQDAAGVSARQAIENFGLDPADIRNAGLHANVCGYLEFHIEQGPVLEQLALPLAAVEAIAGQTRMKFAFRGRANHAGTTPMPLRADAVAAAAEWITMVEQEANAHPGMVATVGSVIASPGAANVIAKEARVSLDVRHRADDVRSGAVEKLTEQAERICSRRGLSLNYSTLLNQPAVAMDPFLIDQIEIAIRGSGCKPYRMASGAGHDAMLLAAKVPAAMIFLRTPGGISHDPAEAVLAEDVAKAIECGMHLLHQLASESDFLKGTRRA